MLSTKPYLVRAFYDWILDSGCTPYVAINATLPNCYVPKEHVQNGEIVFNISPQAVRQLNITNDFIEFNASFSGSILTISAPIKAILAIYAEENGQGMFFDSEDETTTDLNADAEPLQTINQSSEKKAVSHLRLVE